MYIGFVVISLSSLAYPIYSDNFCGYKCSWFLLIKHVLQTFIPTNLIPHACMHACKRLKIKSAKTWSFRESL